MLDTLALKKLEFKAFNDVMLDSFDDEMPSFLKVLNAERSIEPAPFMLI
jgi:hypothetical protein